MLLLIVLTVLQIFKQKDDGTRAKMKKQVIAMEATGHRNILKTFDSFDAEPDGTFYVVSRVDARKPLQLLLFTYMQVMELVDGGELFDHCVNVNGNGSMPEKGLQLAARQLLRGLAHAHLRSLVHLDLKMENILLNKPVTRDDWKDAHDTPDAAIQLKIMDYGFCEFNIGAGDNVKWMGDYAPGTEGYRFCSPQPLRIC